jgi:hypothetical protein
VEERVFFPQLYQDDAGLWHHCLNTMMAMAFEVWLIPIKALKKTDTPGGPVWDAKVALDDYRHHRFQGPAVMMHDTSRYGLGIYREQCTDALNDLELDSLPKDSEPLILDIQTK